jgi:hypothetical protein
VFDLFAELGDAPEDWFEAVNNVHEKCKADVSPPSNQAGWSPCPSGGVVNLAGSNQTWGEDFTLINKL